MNGCTHVKTTHGEAKMITLGNQVGMMVLALRLIDFSAVQIPDSSQIGQVNSSCHSCSTSNSSM